MNKVLAKLIETGLPVATARFHQAVNNVDNVPESQFSVRTDNASRRAAMWLTTMGLVVEQKGKYVIVPSTNLIFTHLLPDPKAD